MPCRAGAAAEGPAGAMRRPPPGAGLALRLPGAGRGSRAERGQARAAPRQQGMEEGGGARGCSCCCCSAAVSSYRGGRADGEAASRAPGVVAGGEVGCRVGVSTSAAQTPRSRSLLPRPVPRRPHGAGTAGERRVGRGEVGALPGAPGSQRGCSAPGSEIPRAGHSLRLVSPFTPRI